MKSLLLRIGIVAVVIVAILLGINAYFVWTNGARLEAQLAELRAAGDPISLKDLARPPIPAEQNAATFLQRAYNDLVAIEKELTLPGPSAGYPDGPLSPAEREKLRKTFDAYPNLIPLLEQAAACPDHDSQFDYTVPVQTFLSRYLSHVPKNRLAARVLRVRTTLLLAEGKRDEALAGMILLFRLCRHFNEPILVGYLVEIACRGIAIHGANAVLQSGTVGARSREALERELARYDAPQVFIGVLKSERAFGLDMFSTMPWSQNWLGRALDYAGKSSYLDMMHEYSEAASRPYWELKPAKPVAPGGWRLLTPYAVMVELVRPGLDAARSAMERNLAMVRALRVLNALQAKTAPDAKEPPRLSDLGLPPEATTDPFNGQPLHVKKLPQGWLVYSVGQNLVDDGGVLGSDPKTSDVGVGPRGSEGKVETK